MTRPLKEDLLAFVAEQHPFAFQALCEVLRDTQLKEHLVLPALAKKLEVALPEGLETTPFVLASERMQRAWAELQIGVSGVFARSQVQESIHDDERIQILKGMILTRATDNAMKRLFMSGEIKFGDKGFQGKGFRSLGQEAIYACAIRLRHGKRYFEDGIWRGDVVGPIIRDLGVVLAFTDGDVELALNAQVGKEGLPMWGKDLHLGDLTRGVLPAAAPLAIATCNIVGMALASKTKGEDRAFFSFIGEGGSSLGEWSEAVNLAAVQNLPVVFCLENNQIALSTAQKDQSSLRVFADKAHAFGIPRLTIDGTDPEEILSAFAWATDRARAGLGPTLLELISMRMCGHAHHDDMAYWGKEIPATFEIPEASGGYVDAKTFQAWRARDPLMTYSRRLVERKICSQADIRNWKKEAQEKCESAITSLAGKEWPNPNTTSKEVFSKIAKNNRPEIRVEEAPSYSPQGSTCLEAIALATKEFLSTDPNACVIGEDVAPPYGNAFMLFHHFPQELTPRFINTPISENAIVGACVGMSLEGMHPVGEMQFNDFSACGFNQIVNNAAKFYYRTGRNLPFVLRMPWGGLRRAGPFHSQDTTPWYYRAFGLKIVVPSTPHDARALLHAAIKDPDPVLFYEHIALYRDPKIKQKLDPRFEPVEIGQAAFRTLGKDISVISYGAFVHRALALAAQLKEKGFAAEVLDLRSLVPLDLDAIFATVQRTGRVLLLGEDSRTGSILESISSQIAQTCFKDLDAPVTIIGSLDTPVPYSPSLEDAFLPSQDQIFEKAMELMAY